MSEMILEVIPNFLSDFGVDNTSGDILSNGIQKPREDHTVAAKLEAEDRWRREV